MNQTRRNCPKCDRVKSVAKYTEAGVITEHCFGANCGYNRYTKTEVQASDFGKSVYKRQFDANQLIQARSHPTALKYLQKYHITDANTLICYNMKDKRLVFNYKDMYVGRAMDDATPKWYNYTTSDKPFIVTKERKTKTMSVILVEDCISACNVSKVCDSIALLGTNIKDSYLDSILQYDMIYIALDEDATSKALYLQAIIEMVKPCKLIPLQKDLKYYTYLDLEELEKTL